MMSLVNRLIDLVVAVRSKLNTIMPRLLPAGGAIGAVLRKSSSNDYDVEWGNDWRYVVLTSDVSLNATSLNDVAGLSFAPLPNKTYEIEFRGNCRQGNGGWGWQVGMAFPTNLADSSAFLQFGNASNSKNYAYQNSIGGTVSSTAWYCENTSASWYAEGNALLTTGASVNGSVRIQMASNANVYSIVMKKGSFLRYRIVA